MEPQRAELWMTPKRRILSGVFGGRVDRAPVGSPTSVVTLELQEAVGAYFPEAHWEVDAMTRLAASGHDVLGYDCVMPVFSVVQEAAALGCDINWGGRESMPAARGAHWKLAEDVRLPDDFLRHRATRCVLDSLSALRGLYRDRVAVVGKAMGPWTLAYEMFGVTEFLMMVIDDPAEVRRILDRLKVITILFARAQFDAGADVVCIPDHITGNLVGPRVYRDILLPVHQEITQEVQGPLVLHCCGDTLDRLEYFVAAGWDCYHFESLVDAVAAKRVVGDRMSLWGNVNNAGTLLLGSPDEVAQETLYAWNAGVEILGPECAVPLRTPNANLMAIAEAASRLRPGGRTTGPLE